MKTIEHQGRVHVIQNGIESTSYAVKDAGGGWVVMVPTPLPGARGIDMDIALYIINSSMPGWYTAGEAADMLGVHRVTVCRWARDGRFPNAIRAGRGQGGGWRIPERDIKGGDTE